MPTAQGLSETMCGAAGLQPGDASGHGTVTDTAAGSLRMPPRQLAGSGRSPGSARSADEGPAATQPHAPSASPGSSARRRRSRNEGRAAPSYKPYMRELAEPHQTLLQGSQHKLGRFLSQPAPAASSWRAASAPPSESRRPASAPRSLAPPAERETPPQEPAASARPASTLRGSSTTLTLPFVREQRELQQQQQQQQQQLVQAGSCLRPQHQERQQRPSAAKEPAAAPGQAAAAPAASARRTEERVPAGAGEGSVLSSGAERNGHCSSQSGGGLRPSLVGGAEGDAAVDAQAAAAGDEIEVEETELVAGEEVMEAEPTEVLAVAAGGTSAAGGEGLSSEDQRSSGHEAGAEEGSEEGSEEEEEEEEMLGLGGGSLEEEGLVPDLVEEGEEEEEDINEEEVPQEELDKEYQVELEMPTQSNEPDLEQGAAAAGMRGFWLAASRLRDADRPSAGRQTFRVGDAVTVRWRRASDPQAGDVAVGIIVAISQRARDDCAFFLVKWCYLWEDVRARPSPHRFWRSTGKGKPKPKQGGVTPASGGGEEVGGTSRGGEDSAGASGGGAGGAGSSGDDWRRLLDLPGDAHCSGDERLRGKRLVFPQTQEEVMERCGSEFSWQAVTSIKSPCELAHAATIDGDPEVWVAGGAPLVSGVPGPPPSAAAAPAAASLLPRYYYWGERSALRFSEVPPPPAPGQPSAWAPRRLAPEEVTGMDVFGGSGGVAVAMSKVGMRPVGTVERDGDAFEAHLVNSRHAEAGAWAAGRGAALPPRAEELARAAKLYLKASLEEVVARLEEAADVAGDPGHWTGIVQVLHLSPPCQCLSSLNYHRGVDRYLAELKPLLHQIVRLIELLQPVAISLEEVPEFLCVRMPLVQYVKRKQMSGAEAEAAKRQVLVCAWLEVAAPLLEMGYQLDVRLLNSLHQGAQDRTRTMLCAVRRGYELPRPPAPRYAAGAARPPSMVADPDLAEVLPDSWGPLLQEASLARLPPALTLRELIGDLPAELEGKVGSINAVEYRAPERPTPFQRWVRRGADGPRVYDHACRKGKGGKGNEPMEWDEPGGGGTVVAVCAPSAKCKSRHPEEQRICTVAENRRRQGLPDWFRFSGGLEARYKQCGNAVSFLLALAWMGEIWRALTSEAPREKAPDFKPDERAALLERMQRGEGSSDEQAALQQHRESSAQSGSREGQGGEDAGSDGCGAGGRRGGRRGHARRGQWRACRRQNVAPQQQQVMEDEGPVPVPAMGLSAPQQQAQRQAQQPTAALGRPAGATLTGVKRRQQVVRSPPVKRSRAVAGCSKAAEGALATQPERQHSVVEGMAAEEAAGSAQAGLGSASQPSPPAALAAEARPSTTSAPGAAAPPQAADVKRPIREILLDLELQWPKPEPVAEERGAVVAPQPAPAPAPQQGAVEHIEVVGAGPAAGREAEVVDLVGEEEEEDEVEVEVIDLCSD